MHCSAGSVRLGRASWDVHGNPNQGAELSSGSWLARQLSPFQPYHLIHSPSWMDLAASHDLAATLSCERQPEHRTVGFPQVEPGGRTPTSTCWNPKP